MKSHDGKRIDIMDELNIVFIDFQSSTCYNYFQGVLMVTNDNFFPPVYQQHSIRCLEYKFLKKNQLFTCGSICMVDIPLISYGQLPWQC